MRPVIAPPAPATLQIGTRPTFSAVIAAYQAADFIGHAIESLLQQTYPALEIIVCDDGSTDDLEGALNPYRNQVTVIRQDNRGEASARNAAARVARGDFIAILDADDVYLPERLESLAELSEQRPDLDLLLTDCYLVVDGKIVRRAYHSGYSFEADDQRCAILQRNFLVGHVAVRRDRLLAVGGFDESFRWAEDWDCWIRLILTGSSVGMVDEPLAEYRIRPTGLASHRLRLFEGRIAALEKAANRSDLSVRERSVLDCALAAERRTLALALVRVALIEGRPEARRLALGLVRQAGLPVGARVRAAGAVLMPRKAARRLSRSTGSAELAGGVTAPREAAEP